MTHTEKLDDTSKPPVNCSKCGHANAPGTNHCSHCGARLYITCHSCGHSIARVAAKCGYCGHRLHRSVWSKVRRRVFGRNPKITPFQIFLLIAFVILAYKVIVFIVEYRPASYSGE